jgi:hypothetical protein
VPTPCRIVPPQLQVAVVYLTAGTEVLDRRLREQDMLQEQQLQAALQHAQREWQQVQQQQQQQQAGSGPASTSTAAAGSAAAQPLVDCVVHSGPLLQCYSDVKHALAQHRPVRRRQLPTLLLLEPAGDWQQGLVARSAAAAVARTKQITAGGGLAAAGGGGCLLVAITCCISCQHQVSSVL